MSNYWQRMSGRERFLAIATGVIIAVCVIVFVSNRAITRLDSMDQQVAQLEQQLINLHEQDARSQSIEDAFEKVAAQHSSAWTEQEIHDRLRTEIDRLALRNPYPEGGRPATTGAGRSDYLVYVPTLRQGTLKEEGEGYREYQLNLKIEPASLDAIVTFLSRLQQSNQSLWIDRLELARAPESTQIASSIDVTRTVVAGAPAEDEYVSDEPIPGRLRNPSFEYWRLNEKRFPAWDSDGAVLAMTGAWATDGARALAATADRADGQVFQTVELYGGRTYELSADIAAKNPARFTIALEGREEDMPPGQDLIADGKMYRYRLSFHLPGTESDVERLKMPLIIISSKGGEVFVDNLRLKSTQP